MAYGYRDMTFCAARCANLACKRNADHLPTDLELPVSFADFSEECPDYRPKQGSQDDDSGVKS